MILQAFIQQDTALYIDYWGSDYLMVDSVGVTVPQGKDRVAWERMVVSSWADTFTKLGRPVVFHACHAQCGGIFSGPVKHTS